MSTRNCISITTKLKYSVAVLMLCSSSATVGMCLGDIGVVFVVSALVASVLIWHLLIELCNSKNRNMADNSNVIVEYCAKEVQEVHTDDSGSTRSRSTKGVQTDADYSTVSYSTSSSPSVGMSRSSSRGSINGEKGRDVRSYDNASSSVSGASGYSSDDRQDAAYSVRVSSHSSDSSIKKVNVVAVPSKTVGDGDGSVGRHSTGSSSLPPPIRPPGPPPAPAPPPQSLQKLPARSDGRRQVPPVLQGDLASCSNGKRKNTPMMGKSIQEDIKVCSNRMQLGLQSQLQGQSMDEIVKERKKEHKEKNKSTEESTEETGQRSLLSQLMTARRRSIQGKSDSDSDRSSDEDGALWSDEEDDDRSSERDNKTIAGSGAAKIPINIAAVAPPEGSNTIGNSRDSLLSVSNLPSETSSSRSSSNDNVGDSSGPPSVLNSPDSSDVSVQSVQEMVKFFERGGTSISV